MREGTARGGRAAQAGVTPRNGRGATRWCEAPPIRHGNCHDTFPSGEGFLGWLSSGGAPLRSPRFAHACALRHGGKRRRPPAEAGGGYACASGRAAGMEVCGLSVSARVGTAGASRPRPSPKSLRLSGLSFGGAAWVGGTARGGRAALAGVTPRNGRGATRLCGAPPIHHGTAVTPSPPGKDSLVG